MIARSNSVLLFLLFAVLLSCSSGAYVSKPSPPSVRTTSVDQRSPEIAPRDSAPESRRPGRGPVSFQDHTAEIVQRAEILIARNKREGAVLDQRWYGFRRFGNYQDLILGAGRVIVCGGLEADVKKNLASEYAAIEPVEADQDPGEIRLFEARRPDHTWDFVIIAQNGREVVLKTVIRVLYLREFVSDDTRRKYAARLKSFPDSLRVLMSSYTPRQEFADFLMRHRISNPDVVLIGFMNDANSILNQARIGSAKVYSDESLRLTSHETRDGKKILAVSINGNRIFASRAGDFVSALLDVSQQRPPAVIFFGSAGAVEDPNLVWKIATPVSVRSGDTFVQTDRRGELIYIIPNKAADSRRARTAHASVESVVIETTEWAKRARSLGIKTADQELLHVVEAINSSRYAPGVEMFAGVLVTDDISSKPSAGLTLEQAEETISEAVDIRREFLSEMLTRVGVLKSGAPASERRRDAETSTPAAANQ
ncbi:MAG TPA: hypothetical protein VIB79_24140 [Candidatus Binatia bacterium]